jgi:hypothetical protein
MKTLTSTLVAAIAATWVSAAAAITISDPSDWASGWALSGVTLGGVGTATAVVEATSGNPGQRLNVTTVTPVVADVAFGLALYQNTATAAPLAGTAFSMQFDVLGGAGAFGQGQAIMILVEQAGTVYYQQLGVTGFPIASFTTQTYNGAFNAASFTRVIGAGPLTPSFDGVTPTHYGFGAGNSGSATLTQYYDNWSVTFAQPVLASVPVPVLPAALLAFLTLILGVAGLRSLRRSR